MAYVDLNPVRAGLAGSPAEYPWSGHGALREEDGGQLAFHPLYLGLGAQAASRYRAYMELLADEAARPAQSLATTYFVGSRRFAEGEAGKRRGSGARHTTKAQVP